MKILILKPQKELTVNSAGHGTDGADGGNGGIVQIILDENNTHLLMAVKYDVRGGQGGNPGQHGQPGDGGTGGRGGDGHKWCEVPLKLKGTIVS
jgi:hypothetical protein